MDKWNRRLLETVGISRKYGNGMGTWALRGVNFHVEPGEFVAVVGASGSGKSTLLNMIGALDRPTSGHVLIDGVNTSTLTDNELAALRGDTIGFIFQFHYLMSEFTVLENALMPLSIRKGGARPEEAKWVKSLLARVGLGDRITRRPNQLSGGQQQRVAIVRAVANRPRLILADEPTGNLDSCSGAVVFDLLRDLNAEMGMAFVLVTHDDRLARQADRIVAMEDGKIVADYRAADVTGEVTAVTALQRLVRQGQQVAATG